jgi:hypothetical protein
MMALAIRVDLLLARLGRSGGVAPATAVAAGLALPPVAALAHGLLLPAVVVLLAITVALAEPGRLRLVELGPAASLALGNLVLSPIAAFGLVTLTGMGAGGTWVVLLAACPSAGGAALIAGLLGLPLRPVLLGQLVAFFAMPVTAPLIATLLGAGLGIDPLALFLRVAALVGGPALLGVMLRHALGPARRVAAAPALRGLGVGALGVIGLALGDGLPALAANGPATLVVLAQLAMVSALGGVIGLAIGAAWGSGLAAGFALGGAVRNVSLLWGASTGALPEEGELMLRLGLAWTLVLPAAIVAAQRARLTWRDAARS